MQNHSLPVTGHLSNRWTLTGPYVVVSAPDYACSWAELSQWT